ncbi:hypothetical protein E0H45_29210 [Kribbella soli]|uniref:Conserved hypothetical protein CHP02391 domain-containing protein n=1 Tax=Kribbella soli TaxID=1124743 RepID=A0A4V2LYX7_9ACTN|nr:hypothetical protein E0H45_29210 [Kribbella soli]
MNTNELPLDRVATLVDRELVTDGFSRNSGNGRTRLWLPGNRETKMWKSRQDGLYHLAIGAYTGIRNVVAHSRRPD